MLFFLLKNTSLDIPNIWYAKVLQLHTVSRIFILFYIVDIPKLPYLEFIQIYNVYNCE